MRVPSPPPDLTPKHVRAARALLAWSQKDLAKAAGVATSTVADFERGSRTPVANNAQAIRAALENAGIRFLPTGAVIGPPLPIITQSERPAAPIRWVSAEDLADWANRTDGAVSLPTLMAFLVRATHGTNVHLRFPADEGVRHSGWDGRTTAEISSQYVPQGEAGWELSAQRSGVAKKIGEDYRKRTDNPAPLAPARATCIFVTLRRWPQKEEWAKERRDEGPWRDVRVYDADDLVHWIEQAPAVGLWLATRLGKRPPGTRELDEVWQEWSRATKWPLTEELVLSDRDEDAVEILRWLRGAPSVLSLRATTAEEVVAFFHAVLSELPGDLESYYRARTLVVTTADAARTFAHGPAPTILLLTEPDPGLARSLSERGGHHVLQAYDDRPVSSGEMRTLARPSREGIAAALMNSGITEPRAKAFARDSARNLAVLRRLIPGAPGRLPKWAEEPPPGALLAALLVGGWDENVEADRARLSELVDLPYDGVVAVLASLVGELDSPLQKIGSTWRVASPFDAWFLLAHHLTGPDIDRFESLANAVLGSADPRFEMDPSERWMAAVRGVHPEYSGLLRHGVGQTLILLALWGNRIRTVPDAGQRADVIVTKLLQNADPQRWWSLSRDFRLLAEAAPSAFMDAIESSLDRQDPPIGALFGHDEGGLFGTEHLSNLLWALESLAWSPDWMPRVTRVLARLDAIDVKPRRYANGPANSLREIHLLWNPQTYAMLDERLRALDAIRKREPNAAWKLMLGILPSGHDVSSPSPMPRWRDFTVDKTQTVTWALVQKGAAAINERLLEDVGLSPERWAMLLDRLGHLAPGPDPALAALDAAEPRIMDKADRLVLWNKLRGVLHDHRQFPNAEWSLEDGVLSRLEVIYDRFAPLDPLEQTAWLFQEAVQLPTPSAEGWEAESREIDLARQRAAQQVFARGGVSAVLALARLTGAAGYLGKALYGGGLPPSDVDALIAAALQSDNARERNIAHGLIICAFRDRKESWGAALVAQARREAWGDTALTTILHALPVGRWTWDQVTKIGGEIETSYWRQIPVFWMSDDTEDVAYAIRMLIRVGRARHALPLAGRRKNVHLPTQLLVEVLQEAARQPLENEGDGNEVTMFQYNVAETLQVLDERDDIDRNALVALEWNYLYLLEHSQRPAKALLRAISEQPSLFIQMLSATFKATDESGVVDPEPEDPERARRVATQAYRLLSLWNHLPGTRDDGTFDEKALEAWIKDARSLAKAAGREDIADIKIGEMLSASPMGADGAWPAEPVREVLDLFRSTAMLDGFRVGKSNRRGATIRMPRDGGELERQEAAKYRSWAKVIGFDHPHTAKALETLAERYEWEARRQDESAERLDWES